MNWIKSVKNRFGDEITLITSWDDFGDYDWRLAELLRKYELPGIFFIPVKELLMKDKLKLAREISKDFVIGSHTINHPDLKTIPYANMVCEIRDSKTILEDRLGQKIFAFCYPRGRFNPVVKNEVKRAGYMIARTTNILSTNPQQNLLEMKTTAHVYSGRKEYEGRKWQDVAKLFFDEVVENGGYFHLWGHGLEIEKNNEWDNLDKFLSYVRTQIKDL